MRASTRERGDDVWAGCRRPADADELQQLTDHVHELDVASEDSIAQFAATVGVDAVDVLLNNAGIDGRALGVPDGERDVLQLSAEHFLDEIRVNALGPMLLTRHLVEPLRKAANPRIVNVSSTVGSMEVARAIGRDVGYVTSKAALNMITVKLANRLAGDGIIAVAVHPGLLRTALATPRGGELEDPAVGAAELVDLIDGLTLDQSGSFLHRDGTVHAW